MLGPTEASDSEKCPELSALLSERLHLKFHLRPGLQNKLSLKVSISPKPSSSHRFGLRQA